MSIESLIDDCNNPWIPAPRGCNHMDHIIAQKLTGDLTQEEVFEWLNSLCLEINSFPIPQNIVCNVNINYMARTIREQTNRNIVDEWKSWITWERNSKHPNRDFVINMLSGDKAIEQLMTLILFYPHLFEKCELDYLYAITECPSELISISTADCERWLMLRELLEFKLSKFNQQS